MDGLTSQILHDRYLIQTLLGRKTGRRTFLARDLQTNSPVVIKLLLFGPDFTWDDLKLFEREAETLQSLDHPAIPKYLNSFEVETELGKGFVLVQSYIEAQSLQNWIESGRNFSEQELKAIAEDLLGILDYLHNRQPPVVHRDIKPSNILLGNRTGNSPGKVYLIDFGSVQTVAHGGTVTVVGTYGYMPPEQFGGRSLPASDLYSLGATLIYLATGQHPADLPQKDLKVDFEQFTNLNSAFIRWIQWLTEPSISKRPISAKEALQSFQQVPQNNLTSNKQFPDIQRPASTIQLEAIPTVLKLTVPQIKLDLSLFEKATSILTFIFNFIIKAGLFTGFYILSILLSILMFSVLTSWVQWWGMILSLMLGGLLVFMSFLLLLPLVQKNFLFFQKHFSSLNKFQSYNIIFEREDDTIFVDLISNDSKKHNVFPHKKLHSISINRYDLCKYRLKFLLTNSSGTFYITGTRLEILWLCDELNEWTGLEIQYRY